MRTATATLIAAATSKERQPCHAVLSDFAQDGTFVCYPGVFRDVYNDIYEGIGDMGTLTPFVESVDIDEALATELPAGARSFPGGYASAQATIVLSGNLGGVRLVDLFSGFDNPLSTLAPRIGCPTVISLGFIGTAGPETLPMFTGKIRSCSIDPDAGTVTMVALDNRERFRTPVVLPVVYADDHGLKRPGLNAQWMIDAIARRQGYHATPPLRANCILSATLHGSAYPEVGSIVYARSNNLAGTIVRRAAQFAPHYDGLLGLSATPFVSQSDLRYAPSSPPNLNNGSTIFIEYDHITFPNQGDSSNLIMSMASSTTAGWTVSINADTTSNFLRFIVTRNGATSGTVSIAFAALDNDSGTPTIDHYLGIQITFTATGFVVQAKLDATTGTVTGVVANSTGSPDMDRMTVLEIGDNVIMSGLQVTTEAYTAGMFNDGFVPTALYDPSLNELTSTPIVDTSDPWLLVQQIADAEQGLARFDGDTFTFRNRDFLTGGAAVATITTDGSVSFANLKQSASSDEAIDTVNNVITATATPYTLDPTSTLIWGLSELVMVPAGGSITIPAEFPGPVYTLASLTHRASETADGTGGDITLLNVTAVPVTASTYSIVISNPTLTDAWLVGNLSGGTPGEPNLNAVGRCTRPSESGYRSVATDAASVALYDAQPLDIPDTPWRQSATPLNAYTAGLLANLKDPHPEIGDLETVGDPRRQLGDRVRVADPDGLTLDDDFWLVANKTRYSASDGLAQSVTLRQA